MGAPYQSYPPSLWASPPASTVVSVAPNTAAVGAAPLLTVTGTGFTAESVVSFEGDARPTTLVSPTSLTAQLAAITGVARSVPVAVSTGGSTPFVITAVEEEPEPDPTSEEPCEEEEPEE